MSEVTPLNPSGLHCSPNSQSGSSNFWVVTPLNPSGLHCSIDEFFDYNPGEHVTPLNPSGLHCSAASSSAVLPRTVTSPR